jgi:pimeloyl-ACP methyl ester carboxylesterase
LKVQRRDIKAVGLLASEASGVVTTLVRDMHAGIAGRVFSSVGPSSRPTQVVHEGLTRAIYGAVGRGLCGATTLGGVVASEVWGHDDDEPLERRDGPGGAIAAINGIYGDQLATQRNPLALTMQIRRHGAPVALTDDALSSAFPEATARLAVFVHGWCLTERSWQRRPRSGDEERTYGQRLYSDGGFTPVHLRYNTGLHISQNGRTLAELLEQLQLLWPVPIDELVLVGHSMGGLVVRSACYYGVQQHHWWTASARHVVCLGSPHMGADLEKGVNVAAWALTCLPETRAVAGFLNTRSSGVKDLRFGSCRDEDWRDCDPDEFLRDRCHEASFLPNAEHHFVATTVTPKALGRVVGDHLVRPYSATGAGRSRQLPFDRERGLTLTGLNHFDLLNHPLVYAKLRDWVVGASAAVHDDDDQARHEADQRPDARGHHPGALGEPPRGQAQRE